MTDVERIEAVRTHLGNAAHQLDEAVRTARAVEGEHRDLMDATAWWLGETRRTLDGLRGDLAGLAPAGAGEGAAR